MAKVSEHRKSYEIINNTITSLLEQGEVPWKNLWASGEPINFITQKTLQGNQSLHPYFFWLFMPILGVLQASEGKG